MFILLSWTWIIKSHDKCLSVLETKLKSIVDLLLGVYCMERLIGYQSWVGGTLRKLIHVYNWMSNFFCFHWCTCYDYRDSSANTCIHTQPRIWMVFIINKPIHIISTMAIHKNSTKRMGLFWPLIIPVSVISKFYGRVLSCNGYNGLRSFICALYLTLYPVIDKPIYY